jgi:hypothetical protein
MEFRRTAVAAVLLFLAMVLAPPALAGPFDGTRAFSTQSNRANCGGNTNELSVNDGRISGEFQGQNGIYVARGKISDAGKVKFNLDS